MEPIIPLIFLGIAAVIGAVSFFFSDKLKVMRELNAQKATPIANFKHAQIGKIVGRVKKVNLILNAPLSGRPCVFYQVIVEQKVSSGKSTSWKKIIHDQKAVNFMVTDGATDALIELEKVNAYLVKDVNLKSSTWSPASRKLELYLRQHKTSSSTFLGQKTLRYKEGILHIGETVAVKGQGLWELEPDPALQKLIMNGNPDLELFISDDKSALA